MPPRAHNLWDRSWDWHGAPERDPSVFGKRWLAFGNQILACDLIDAVERDQELLSGVSSVRFINEVVEGDYRSHLSGGIRVKDRSHPWNERDVTENALKGRESGRKGLGWVLVTFTILSWGSLVVLLKLLVPEIDPRTLTWYRFAFGAILILAFSGGNGIRDLTAVSTGEGWC